MSAAGFNSSFKLLLGTMFGAGYLTIAPGTLGSFLTLPLIYATFTFFGIEGLFLLTLLASIISMWTAPAAVKRFGSDPAQFIMDECAGQSLVFAIAVPFGVPVNLLYLFLGFLLFRLFDIIKPLGIKRAEKFRGKFGILADDLLAGLYASIGLTGLLLLISTF